MRSSFPPRPFAKIFASTALLLGLAAPVLHAEMRTLTDKQGRSLKAEVIAVKDDTVTIKREDGQTFTLSLATLSDDDQKSLQAWAKQQAALIPAGGVEVQISRGKFSTKKKDENDIILSEEEWGYTATFFNRTSKTLKGVRIVYILFVKPDAEPGKDTTKAPLKQQQGSKVLDVVDPRGSVNFRTSAITIYKQQLKPGWIWTKTGSNNVIKDTLFGVWMRVYVGDQLVDEVCSPESIAKTEAWTGP